MNSIEFVLWLAGAVDLVGEEPPTAAQWAAIREKAGMAVGKIAADKLLERAHELMNEVEKDKAAQEMYLKQMLAQKQYYQIGTQSTGIAPGMVLGTSPITSSGSTMISKLAGMITGNK